MARLRWGAMRYYHGSITIDHSWYNGTSLVLHSMDSTPATVQQSQHHHSRV
jgi:hypothetical protein